MAEPNFLDSDLELLEDEDFNRESSSSIDPNGNLTNKDLIEKLREQKQKLLQRVDHIEATIQLLKSTPNYSRIHDMLNTEI